MVSSLAKDSIPFYVSLGFAWINPVVVFFSWYSSLEETFHQGWKNCINQFRFILEFLILFLLNYFFFFFGFCFSLSYPKFWSGVLPLFRVKSWRPISAGIVMFLNYSNTNKYDLYLQLKCLFLSYVYLTNHHSMRRVNTCWYWLEISLVNGLSITYVSSRDRRCTIITLTCQTFSSYINKFFDI